MNIQYDHPRLAQMLATVRHFQSLQEADLEAIISAGHVHHYAAEQVLFQESTPCAGLFVLIKGHVQLHKLSPEGRKQIMSVLKPVIMFNQVPMLDGGDNVTTAVAVEPTIVWRAPRDAMLSLLQRYPEMSLGLLTVLARRNRFLTSQVADLSFRSVVARTAKLLLTLSHNGEHAIDRYANPNTDLAARVATVPEAFSRALSLMRKDRLIQCTRDKIIILSPDGVTKMAQL